MDNNRFYEAIIILFFAAIFFTCASTPQGYVAPPPTTSTTVVTPPEPDKNREEKILSIYTEQKKEKYSELLVPIERYTTKGNVFQQKYNKYLIGIAGDIVENKKMKVVAGSIGFYYDKKLNDREHLYLGLDIEAAEKSGAGYHWAAVNFIKRDLKSLMHTVYSCKTVFNEAEIIGLVIGWRWDNNGIRDIVNIWISKEDVFSFENSKLTFDELIQRSTITNTEGKIIKLAI